MGLFTVPTEARSFTGWINTRAATTLLRRLGRSVVSTPEVGPGWFCFRTVVDDREDQLPQDTVE